MRITGLYAAIAVVIVVVLAIRVVLRRRETRIGIGDGGDGVLLTRIRIHGNAIEYLPFGLILLLLVELNQTAPVVVHAFGIVLIVARVLHAVGLSRSSGKTPGRVLGVILTLLALLGMAALLLWQHLVVALA